MYYKVVLKGFSSEDRFEEMEFPIVYSARELAEDLVIMIQAAIDVNWEYDAGEYGKETLIIDPLRDYNDVEDTIIMPARSRIEKGGIYRDNYEIIEFETWEDLLKDAMSKGQGWRK